MKRTFKILFSLALLVTLCYNQLYSANDNEAVPNPDKKIIAENDSIEILYQVVDPAKDEYDVPVVALWIKDKASDKQSRLLQTIRPEWQVWYYADKNRFFPVPIDSILVISRVVIYNDNPLQLIVQGRPDCRNEFAYFIDVPSRQAWYVPANSGYMGSTEEGYMVFHSFRYVSNPEIAGRYTFLQIFNNKGVLVDSLDLEHVKLSEYQAEENQ